MTVTMEMLDNEYAWMFRGCRHADEAKAVILDLFGKEPDSAYEWTEQDIYEQMRKIIQKYE